MEEKRMKTCIGCDHSWLQLPQEIMEIIFQRLGDSDCVRSSLVCKSWRSIITHKDFHHTRDLPWILLHLFSECKIIKIFSQSEGKVHTFTLPESVQGGICLGSSKGWLIMIIEEQTRSEIFLFDPISKAKHLLPSVTTLPNFELSLIRRIELSSPNISDCAVAAIFGKELALCRPGDHRWTICPIRCHSYGDLLFSHEKLYVTARSCNLVGVANVETPTMKLKLGTLDVVVELLLNIVEGENLPLDFHDYGALIKPVIATYLVESTNNEVLLVKKIKDFKYRLVNNSHNETCVPRRRSCSVVTYFEIYQIDPKSHSLHRLQRLDGQLLFLTSSSRLSIPVCSCCLNDLRGNCIYFSDDYVAYGFTNLEPSIARQRNGIFNIDTGRCERLFPRCNLRFGFGFKWFAPNIW